MEVYINHCVAVCLYRTGNGLNEAERLCTTTATHNKENKDRSIA